MRTLHTAGLLVASLFAAAPVLADETTGTVQSYDPAARILVMTDRSVWHLPVDLAVPEDLQPGERVRVVYRSHADGGWDSFHDITRAEN